MSLPKVLIVGQSFNNDTGGGITLTNLFADWRKEQLAVACSGYLLLDNIDTETCNTYYQVGHKEKKWVFPFNYLRRKYDSGLVKFDKKLQIQNLTIPKSKFRVKLIMDYFYPFVEYIGLSHSIYKTNLSADFRKWLDEFNPDVIYAQASSRDGLLFCSLVQSYLKKPFIFHMMDDWPSTIADKGLFKNYWRKRIGQEFQDLLDGSDMLMTISSEMAKEYKRRYNKDSVVFHNPIQSGFWQQYQRKEYYLNGSPTLLYAGRTGLGIQSTLVTISKAISNVNKNLNTNIKFVLQTVEKPDWANEYDCVVHKNFVPYEDLPRAFAEADLLILPYDFSRDSIKYIQYSMPTKASEYMISGTPIIIFAPEVTAIVKYAKEYGWAKIVTENNSEDLTEVIENLILNPSERERIAKKAIAIAEKNHDAAVVTSKFREAILSLVPVNNLVDNG